MLILPALTILFLQAMNDKQKASIRLLFTAGKYSQL